MDDTSAIQSEDNAERRDSTSGKNMEDAGSTVEASESDGEQEKSSKRRRTVPIAVEELEIGREMVKQARSGQILELAKALGNFLENSGYAPQKRLTNLEALVSQNEAHRITKQLGVNSSWDKKKEADSDDNEVDKEKPESKEDEKPAFQKETSVDKKNEGKKSEDKSEDGKNEKKDEKKDDEPGSEKLPEPKVNRISWAAWQKLRKNEREYEDETDSKKKKKMKKPVTYAIDVVADNNDLGIRIETGGFGALVSGRIRINSKLTMEAFNDATGLLLPTPCIMLHPFKPLFVHETAVRSHLAELEAQLRNNEEEVAKQEMEPSRSEGTERRTEQSAETSGATPSGGDVETQVGSSKPVRTPTLTNTEEKSKALKEKIDHYNCLIEFLNKDFSTELELAHKVADGLVEKIHFSHLWFLFRPGTVVYEPKPQDGRPAQAYQVLHVSGGRPKLDNRQSSGFMDFLMGRYASGNGFQGKVSPVTIDCMCLDFDGSNFRPIQISHEIPYYTGENAITDLKLYPLRYSKDVDAEEKRTQLITRGKKFVQLANVPAAHREYRGLTLDKDDKEEVDSRVIIDFANAASSIKEHEDTKGRKFGLGNPTASDYRETSELMPGSDYLENALWDDTVFDKRLANDLFSKIHILKVPSQKLDAKDLDDEAVLLLPGYVYAYVLRSRKYRKCDLQLISPVRLNENGFDSLVLPSRHKTLLKALVDTHSLGSRPVTVSGDKARDEPMDIVPGKGKGLIILLHGVPGVGKTSTAETIADATNRPLLPVTCGDIGETAADVESKLEHIFTLAHRWGCVLLLDEADVFLAKRNKQDMRRNAIVSVFLRILEYYAGILFLTTNRVGTIDEAFKSRIHISLYYPPLDWKTTKAIWRHNLRLALEKVDANEAEILKFARRHFEDDPQLRWNGRQIYNAFQTSVALAGFAHAKSAGDSSKPKLTAEEFKQVAKTSKSFEDYLRGLYGGDDAEMSRREYLRFDEWRKERNSGRKGNGRSGPRKSRQPILELTSDESEDEDEEEEEESEDFSPESSEEAKPKKKRGKRDIAAKRKKGSKAVRDSDEDKGRKGKKGKKSRQSTEQEVSEKTESE
ncbi:MAG: hypothetical protein M1820_009997 [Bogoriella megaspora]|nr:MAG: hypothetical protein M1820_009997 [Bogoriella megaspora]